MSDNEDGPQNPQQPLPANPPPYYGYSPLPPAPPGFLATQCARCNAIQNVPENSNVGFYTCWQCNTLNYPPQLQQRPPAPKKPMSKKEKKNLVLGGITAVLILSVVGYVVSRNETESNKIVAESHSDDPKVQAFYDRLIKDGFGTMRRGDAMKWAKEACNNTDGFTGIWGENDRTGESYGPLDTLPGTASIRRPLNWSIAP